MNTGFCLALLLLVHAAVGPRAAASPPKKWATVYVQEWLPMANSWVLVPSAEYSDDATVLQNEHPRWHVNICANAMSTGTIGAVNRLVEAGMPITLSVETAASLPTNCGEFTQSMR